MEREKILLQRKTKVIQEKMMSACKDLSKTYLVKLLWVLFSFSLKENCLHSI